MLAPIFKREMLAPIFKWHRAKNRAVNEKRQTELTGNWSDAPLLLAKCGLAVSTHVAADELAT